MKNTIFKIFSKELDEQVHDDFIKFGKGVFENRFLIEGKHQKDKWNIKTSAEFANYFVKRCLPKDSKIKISGIIATTMDLRKEISFDIEHVKQFAGVKQFMINTEVESREILRIMEKYPRAFYALSFIFSQGELKIKAKPPKSGKPGKKGENEAPKADFCTLKTSDRNLINDLFFDFTNFKEIKIKHALHINEIEIPKNVQDPKELRERSKRKGLIKRIIDVDGRREVKEKDFLA